MKKKNKKSKFFLKIFYIESNVLNEGDAMNFDRKQKKKSNYRPSTVYVFKKKKRSNFCKKN